MLEQQAYRGFGVNGHNAKHWLVIHDTQFCRRHQGFPIVCQNDHLLRCRPGQDDIVGCRIQADIVNAYDLDIGATQQQAIDHPFVEILIEEESMNGTFPD